MCVDHCWGCSQHGSCRCSSQLCCGSSADRNQSPLHIHWYLHSSSLWISMVSYIEQTCINSSIQTTEVRGVALCAILFRIMIMKLIKTLSVWRDWSACWMYTIWHGIAKWSLQLNYHHSCIHQSWAHSLVCRSTSRSQVCWHSCEHSDQYLLHTHRYLRDSYIDVR